MKHIGAAFLAFALYVLPLSGVGRAAGEPAMSPSQARLLQLVRQRIHHVFVIYQENRSFDSYFGSFPGAENLASPLAQAHGFRQYDGLGKQWVTPFRITFPDTADVDHARPALIGKADDGRMDQFVGVEETRALAKARSLVDAQRLGLLTMAYEDCDVVPYLWKYANEFALFDHFFQAMYGPSTPGNIDLIAAQTGQSQWKRHPNEAVSENDVGAGVPVVNDLLPAFDPYPPGRNSANGLQDDLKFATLFLTLSGDRATNATADTEDVADDVKAIAKLGHPSVPWGWYQEGFHGGDPDRSYVVHHNSLQYFGYLRNNAYFWNGVHDVSEVVPAIENGTLGDRGVVFVKGGYQSPYGFKPANPDPSVQKHFQGDDDHPGYSDAQVSEASVAKVVNAVAGSKYWDDSVILILWDDSEGFYDHVSPPQFETCPDGKPCGDGPRVPAIMISPFSKDHQVVSEAADHTSFAKFLGRVFDLPALASLPDEAPFMPEGPRDLDPRVGDLLAGFDVERLSGMKLPIAKERAVVDDIAVPAKESCSSLHIVPQVIPGSGAAPHGFSPLLTGE